MNSLPKEIYWNIFDFISNPKDVYGIGVSCRHAYKAVCSKYPKELEAAQSPHALPWRKWINFARMKLDDLKFGSPLILKTGFYSKANTCIIGYEGKITFLGFGNYGTKGKQLFTNCEIEWEAHPEEKVSHFCYWRGQGFWVFVTTQNRIFRMDTQIYNIYKRDEAGKIIHKVETQEIKINSSISSLAKNDTFSSFMANLIVTKLGKVFVFRLHSSVKQLKLRPVQFLNVKTIDYSSIYANDHSFDSNAYFMLDESGNMYETEVFGYVPETPLFNYDSNSELAADIPEQPLRVETRKLDFSPYGFKSVTSLHCPYDLPWYLTDEASRLYYFRFNDSKEIRMYEVEFFTEKKLRVIKAVCYGNSVAAITADYRLFFWQHLMDPEEIEHYSGGRLMSFIDLQPAGKHLGNTVFCVTGIDQSLYLLKSTDTDMATILPLLKAKGLK
eukprot:snap_masked-scaffold_4-processed-gene-20.16-mRNA-1 protein AED:0.10 eAED:0.16 QI:0/-1/0/1/-1/1/1/0/441